MNGSFEAFFEEATGHVPYEWQNRVAVEGLPSILPIPTGLGKTEGICLAWAWRLANGYAEPRHLVYCLPMRTLVRQTCERLHRCFERLRSRIDIPVYRLMGGAIEDEWARWPEKPWVLVGTQDQLLSRALNRGYGMSRFQWPVHFGLLNQDCQWVIDEIQLMGPGLWTTAQLDWMRRKRFRCLLRCSTTWMSATVGTRFLATRDRTRDGLGDVNPFEPRLSEDERVAERLAAKRPVSWFTRGNRNAPFERQLATAIAAQHTEGTLSLVFCNTVERAKKVFMALPDSFPKVLLTSRFRRRDREAHEMKLLEFEDRRQKSGGKPLPGNRGLICVSTQVLEAGVDVSAHRLWSEVAPWPSVLQRVGRLNRDGRDPDAQAWFWTVSQEDDPRGSTTGPYDAKDVERARRLLDVIKPLSTDKPFFQALGDLAMTCGSEVDAALQPKLEPMPRALDVHGLFSTEPDVHGGFTDVSGFVRGTDSDADLIVVWRDWVKGERGAPPPSGELLDGPPLDPATEGCPVPFTQLVKLLEAPKARAWVWNEDSGRWERVPRNGLRPGMVVMLHRETGGYDVALGWTGDTGDKLDSVDPPGPGRLLRDDTRTETDYWQPLDSHLDNARAEAARLSDALNLKDDSLEMPGLRSAIVEAATRHDLGKLHPRWQEALPAASVERRGPWAKCPRVLAVDIRPEALAVGDVISRRLSEAVPLGSERRTRAGLEIIRLRWVLRGALSREQLGSLWLDGVRWVGYVPFRPGLRHEAASALAMWHRYREGRAPYPALAVYLAAAHHGKVRTVLRSISDSGDDVFGVPRDPAALETQTQPWPLDFSVAKDGAEGTWHDGHFVLTGHGWTGLVADLLGPWRAGSQDMFEAGVVPHNEARSLGPFVLAYLEALVRVADWRASEKPSRRVTPAEVSNER